MRWSAQILTLIVLCPSLALALFLLLVPALEFGSAVEYNVQGFSRAVSTAGIYAGSSLLIVGVPMLASVCRIGRNSFLLPEWSLGFIMVVTVGAFLVYAAILFPAFASYASPRATLGHTAKLSLAPYTALILTAGMILVRDGPGPPDWRSRHRTLFLVALPLVPPATATIILGLAVALPT